MNSQIKLAVIYGMLAIGFFIAGTARLVPDAFNAFLGSGALAVMGVVSLVSGLRQNRRR